jgi:diguanylate cyclase (GGDEF)-like protein
LAEARKKTNQPLVLDQFKVHESFCKCLFDAFVILDESGKIQKSNPLFSQLVGVRSRQILKANSLNDLIRFDVGGKDLNVEELIGYESPTRIDEVRGRVQNKEDLNLIVGIYPFVNDGAHSGSFILMRDVTAETNLQDKYFDKATQSITDALTGLYNRAYFVDYMSSQISALEQLPKESAQRTISVIMFDIDHFKKTNDVFGHQAGDYVIKMVAQTMKKTFRKTDINCRYGGEEFLAILPGTEGFGACVAAEKLRLAIQETKFKFENQVIPVAISSGVAQILIGTEKGEDAIARADAALYRSKESGRNQVSFHDGKDARAPELNVDVA